MSHLNHLSHLVRFRPLAGQSGNLRLRLGSESKCATQRHLAVEQFQDCMAISQQLHYLCESDDGVEQDFCRCSAELQYSMRIILWGVHLPGHVMREFPTSVKSMQQPSDVMKRTVLTCSNVMRSQNNPAKPTSLLERWKGAFGIDSRLGCTQCPGCQVPGSGLMQVFN